MLLSYTTGLVYSIEPLANFWLSIWRNSTFSCLNYFNILEFLWALKSKDVYKGVLFILSFALRFKPPYPIKRPKHLYAL